MEVGAPGGASAFRALRLLVALTFAVLAALLIVVLAHGYFPDASLIVPAQVLTAALAGLAVASLTVGVVWAWKAHPEHKKAIAFVVALTLVTLLAHLYIIDTPAATVPGSVSGQVGTTFSDDRVEVGTSYANGTLHVSLAAKGNALAQANLTEGGVPLAGRWTGTYPSYATPLEPGTATTGTWNLPSGSAGSVTVSYQYLTCDDTTKRVYGCIMDEIYYVPAAQTLLSGYRCAPGSDPVACGQIRQLSSGAVVYMNFEHPWLAKGLMAAGMAVFGEYNAVGWRVMPVLLGTFSVPLLFGIAWKVSESKKVAGISGSLLALDVMFFSQSSAALIDVPEVFFGLAAFFAYFAGLRVWKFDRHVIAGVMLGLAGLSKESAVFLALAFMTYVLFLGEGSRTQRVYDVFKVALVIGIVVAAGLEVYDTTLGSGVFSSFVQNAELFLSNAGGSRGTGWCLNGGSCPNGPYITPLDWIVWYSPVQYIVVSTTVSSASGAFSYIAFGYYGVTNLLLTWTVYVWVPLVAYTLYRYYRRPKLLPDDAVVETVAPPDTTEREVRFGGLALILFLWNFVPYIFLHLAGWVTYPFYFTAAVPGLALGAAFWLSKSWFPRWLLYLYLGTVFLFFLVYFPDKGFLPIWLRVLLRH